MHVKNHDDPELCMKELGPLILHQMEKNMGLSHDFSATMSGGESQPSVMDYVPSTRTFIEDFCKKYFEYPEECVIGFYELKDSADPCANAIGDKASCMSDFDFLIIKFYFPPLPPN